VFLCGWFAVSLPAAEIDDPLSPRSFDFSGKSFLLEVIRDPQGAHVWLQRPEGSICLSSGFAGENISPRPQIHGAELFITWVQYLADGAAFGIWRWRDGSVRRLPLQDFRFISSPKLLFQEDNPVGWLFLGNCSGQDRLFTVDWNDDAVHPVSGPDVSIKKWEYREIPQGWEISAWGLQDEQKLKLSKDDLTVVSLSRSRKSYPFSAQRQPDEDPCLKTNTYIAFGDSITWGKMRMYALSGEYHPELAYPEVMKSILNEIYGQAYSINEGVSGDSTLNGVNRVNQVLAKDSAAYFLILLGTNDCILNDISIAGSLENLEWIIDQALAGGMAVIISTIPPRKDAFGGYDWVKRNIADLNFGILTLAAEQKFRNKSVANIDTHKAFMDFAPPEGWKTLLEDIGGNHPSPKGQETIAGLFAGKLAAFPPEKPGAITILKNTTTRKQFRWNANCEADLWQYNIEYGYSSKKLSLWLSVAYPECTLYTFPFKPTIYFRIQSEDKGGAKSSFSEVIALEAK
jgi:lysophospholipase L1-like esterase